MPAAIRDRVEAASEAVRSDLEKLQRRMFEIEKAGDVTDWLDSKGL